MNTSVRDEQSHIGRRRCISHCSDMKSPEHIASSGPSESLMLLQISHHDLIEADDQKDGINLGITISIKLT